MFSYKNILRDKNIIDLYHQVDLTTNYVVSHGLQHMLNVIKHAKALGKCLKLTKEQQKLLLISAVLHDTGRLENNKEHHIYGEKFARQYLAGKLQNEEIEIVAKAILYHSKEGSDFEKTDAVAWCLQLADKLDFEKSRLIKKLLYQATAEKFNLYKQTEKIKISLKDDVLVISIITNSKDFKNIFKKYKEGCRELYENFANYFSLQDYKFIFRYKIL